VSKIINNLRNCYWKEKIEVKSSEKSRGAEDLQKLVQYLKSLWLAEVAFS
jgi:hypothetical protein